MAGALDDSSMEDPALVRVASWAKHPFSSDMDALEWVLWLGLVLAAVWLWTRLLRHFGDE